MTVDDAAARLGCSTALVYKLCQRRLLGHYKLGCPGARGRGGRLLITEAQLAEYLAACERPAEGRDKAARDARPGLNVPDVLARYGGRRR